MMSIFRVNEGGHAFKPSVSFNIDHRIGYMAWRVSFGKSCTYDISTNDRYDWNKLCGLSFCLTTNHKDSAMVGWRYNPETGYIELTPYLHVDGKRVMGPLGSGHVLATVLPDQEFDCWIDVDWYRSAVTVNIKVGDDTAFYKHLYPQLHRSFLFLRTYFTREIGAWFGGNLPAPHTMYLEKRQIKKQY